MEPQKLSYNKIFRAGNGKKKIISTYLPHECVEAHKENTTINMNHDWYCEHDRGKKRLLTGTLRKIPRIRC